jgi:hypothetical protein
VGHKSLRRWHVGANSTFNGTQVRGNFFNGIQVKLSFILQCITYITSGRLPYIASKQGQQQSVFVLLNLDIVFDIR